MRHRHWHFNSTAAVPSVDPATLALTVYLKDYAGAPWAGTASAGTSASQAFSVGSAPSIGASFGSHASASFNGSANNLVHATFADVVAVAAYSFQFIVNMTAAAAPAGAGNEYLDPAIIGDPTNGEIYTSFTTAGAHAGHYDGSAYQDTTPIPLATGAKACIQVKYDGTNLKCRVNGKDHTGASGWESVAVGHLRGAALAHTVGLGTGYAGLLNGLVAQVLASNTALSDATFDLLYADAQANYGVP